MTRFHRRVAALVCIAVLGPAAAFAAAKTVISMSGSTSVYPLAAELAKKYNQLHSNVGFRIFQGGSDIGINDVAHGRVTIGEASRDPEKGIDPHGLTFTKIARDGVCVITNSSNPIGGLNTNEVQAIFDGSVSSWGSVPGARVRGAIDLLTRTPASGTADAFQQIFMGGTSPGAHRISGTAVAKQSNGLVAAGVRSDPHAVGFVSLDFVNGSHPVPYNGVPCTLRNAKSGQYKGVRNFWMITRGAPRGAAKAFLKWVTHSGSARGIINSNWIPLH
jgi:phosphate transport system substrate-binding protein